MGEASAPVSINASSHLKRRPRLLVTTGVAGLLLGWLQPGLALAQRAEGNAIAQADDAFGTMIDKEVVGIYSDVDVRGFNPQRAGNARMDDVYFDQLATVAPRAKAKTVVRVGFTALDYPMPAPTGIIAYSSHHAGNAFELALDAVTQQYGSVVLDFDMKMPVIRDRFAVSFGLAHGWSTEVDGAKRAAYAIGLVPRLWRGQAEFKPVFSASIQRYAAVRPTIFTIGPFLPPQTEPGKYLGQDWAVNRADNYNTGFVARAPIGERLELRGGAFQSRLLRKENFSETFIVQRPDGLARHRLIADPRQDSYANSWEGVLLYHLGDGSLGHTLIATARGRHRHIESGGSSRFEFGEVKLGDLDPEPIPTFSFSQVDVASLKQTSYALGYLGRLRGVGRVNLGVTRSVYASTFRKGVSLSRSSAEPWLYNASLMVQPSRRVALYAGFVSGLEESGSAPETAANRFEQLTATRTSQIDGGVQVALGRMRLVASVFQIEKPYFSFNAQNLYVEVGDLRHRGVEVSAAGNIGARLNLVAGAVLLQPAVSGQAVVAGLSGTRPVGTPKLHARIDASYRTDLLGGLTLTAGMLHDSKRPASAATYDTLGGRQLFTPSSTTFDLGARQAFTIRGTPVSLRVLVNNIFDKRGWRVLAANSFQADDIRRLNIYLTADF